MASASFKSVVEMFHHRVRSTPDTEAIHFRKDGAWHVIHWKEVGTRSRNIALITAACLSRGASARLVVLVEWHRHGLLQGVALGDLEVDLGNLLDVVRVEQRLALLLGVGLRHGVGHGSSSS